MQSISARVHRTFFAFGIGVAVLMAILMMTVNDDLESTMLENDLDDEVNFLLTRHDAGQMLDWQSAGLIMYYVPRGMEKTVTMPTVFQGVAIPFEGEVEDGDKTYLVKSIPHTKGDIYVARDISVYETREAMFQLMLAGIAAAMLCVSFIFARFGSLRLTRPLSDLTRRIQSMVPGKQMPRLPNDYQDSELRMISDTFNTFLGELEAFVRREQSLMNLASHELRTPIAVVSGAVEILLRRGQLDPADEKTVLRIRNACTEMRDNVDVLLKLARRHAPEKQFTDINLPALVKEVEEDIATRFPVEQRLDIQVQPVSLHTDPALLKMLLLNLIQNALQHTHALVQVEVDEDGIRVCDRGEGLSLPTQEGPAAAGGLGLYIVTLICEALGWQLRATPREGGGTVVTVSLRPL